jgi:hypothetical protein
LLSIDSIIFLLFSFRGATGGTTGVVVVSENRDREEGASTLLLLA